MRNLILIPVVLLCLSYSVFSQADSKSSNKAKFNGVWVFDVKQSKADSSTKERYKGQDLTITYIESEFKIVEPRTTDGATLYATLLFFTDGRGEQNKPYAFNQKVTFDSITNWENDVLVRKYKIPINLNNQSDGAMTYVEKYSISSDGLILTILTELTLDAGAAKVFTNKDSKGNETGIIKRVYRKK